MQRARAMADHGRQLHSARYLSPEEFMGLRVMSLTVRCIFFGLGRDGISEETR